MAIPERTLTKPHVDKALGLPEGGSAPGSEEVERRVQEALLEWLAGYFNATAFTTGGEAGTRTFPACEVRFDEITPTLPQEKPILHTVLSDRRDGEPVRITGGMWETKGTWIFTTDIRTNKQMPSAGTASGLPDSANNSGDRTCRRVADQLAWLLRSSHTQSLSLKGIRRAKVTAGPKLIPSGAYHARLLTFSVEVITTSPRNDP
jgi:hypothetical protein